MKQKGIEIQSYLTRMVLSYNKSLKGAHAHAHAHTPVPAVCAFLLRLRVHELEVVELVVVCSDLAPDL